jgi:type IV secretory pathway ATPase VirB11/archaellum biosynthesis ATPase
MSDRIVLAAVLVRILLARQLLHRLDRRWQTHGGGRLVRYADGHREQRPRIVDSSPELVELVRRIAAESPQGERRFDAAAPILDMSLPDGSRLNAVMDVAASPDGMQIVSAGWDGRISRSEVNHVLFTL